MLAFGLCNAPAVFQQLLNSVYADELGRFVVVYLDDILVYSKSEAEHVEHLRIVLQRLREHKLFAKLSKCQFCRSSVEFLGHVVSADGIGMDKVQAVQDWPQPRTVKDIMQFVGLTNYYRKFVKSYAAITVPLYELLKKYTPFVWGEQQQAAFEALKAALTEAPLLMLPRPDEPYEMHTDASDFAIGAVLYQEDAVSGDLRPIAYESHKLSEVQRRYATHERELLAVVHALKVWRMYLVGCPVTVRTDHAALEWFNTQPKLSQRQARWSIAMQEHKVTFKYVPGHVNVVADALSRRPDLQAATATFELRARTPTGHLVETGPPAPAELPPRRRSQCESIIIAECAPPALQVQASSQGAPAPAQEPVTASTAAASAAEPGTGEDTCDQEAPTTSDAAQIMGEFRRRQPRRACRARTVLEGADEAVPPVPAMSAEEETETPPTAVQPTGAAPTVAQTPSTEHTAARPPAAAQQQSSAATSQVETPPLFDQILQAYRTHDFDPRKSLQGEFVLSDGFWCKRDRDGSLRVVIPEDAKLQENILHELHDSRAHAHMGQRRTTEQVARYFWWPGMTGYVKLYIKHCHTSQVMKAGNRKPAGLLRPLQVPDRPWASVSMDLITALLPSGTGKDCILVVVDRFTKMCHFEACCTTITAVQLAELFTRICWRHHGLPAEIVSDRDPRFTAKSRQAFWDASGPTWPCRPHIIRRQTVRRSAQTAPWSRCSGSL